MDTIELVDMTLTSKSDKEGLETVIDGSPYFIDFTDDNQTALRNFFLVVLRKLEKTKFHFGFKDSGSVKNEMLKKVASDYVDSLNNEIDSVFLKIAEVKKVSTDTTEK
jgi:hypothetical protein